MWANLAADDRETDVELRNAIVQLRDYLSAQMTPEQIAQAQRRASEWKPTVEP